MDVTVLPVIRIPGMADFNDIGQNDRVITDWGNWDSIAPPVPVIVRSGGVAGAVGSGDWAPAEEYYTLSGFVRTPQVNHWALKRQLLAAFRKDRSVPLVRLGGVGEPDLQVWVRLYDRPSLPSDGYRLAFTFPLVALDPYKYGLQWLTGEVGVFTGQSWFEAYSNTTVAGAASTYDASTYDSATYDGAGGLTGWRREYTYNGSKWVLRYRQAVPAGPYPQSLTILSEGDASSQRITAAVTGPLDLGDWWLLNEATGARLWADTALDVGQTITFDCMAKLATLDGSDISSTVYGDWLTLEPGANTFRLVAGRQSDATASVSALPAYL